MACFLRYINRLGLLAALSVLPGLARGQGAARPSGTFRLLGLEISGEPLAYELDGKKVPVFVSSRSLSRDYEIPRDAGIRFYRESRPVPPVPGPPEAAVAEIKVAAGKKRMILLMGKAAPGAGHAYELAVLDDEADVHPAETVRIFNTSSHLVAVKIGAENREIAAGQIQRMAFPSRGGAVTFQIAVKEEGRWDLVLSTVEPAAAGSRGFVFLTDRAGANRHNQESPIATRIIYDRVPAGPSP